MTIQQQKIEKIRQLPPEKQKEVLDFVDSLHKEEPPQKLRSLEGLWADLDIDITDEDITQARKEMWGGSQRKIE